MQIIIILTFLINGLATMFGSFICCCSIRKTNKSFTIALGFMVGIMIYMSMYDIVRTSNIFSKLYPRHIADVIVVCLLFIGIFLSIILDNNLEKVSNKIVNVNKKIVVEDLRKLAMAKIVIFSILSIAIHNIPEGLFVIKHAYENPDTFYLAMLPMMLHNILEGLVIAFPLQYFIKNKFYVVLCSFFCAVVEVLGLFMIVVLSHNIFDYYIISFLIILSSSMMLYISFNKVSLIAGYYGNSNTLFVGILFGITTMMTHRNIVPNILRTLVKYIVMK